MQVKNILHSSETLYIISNLCQKRKDGKTKMFHIFSPYFLQVFFQFSPTFATDKNSQQPPDVGFQSLFQGHCAANVATLGGRSKPERLCAFCACAFCIGGLATCDHCAANVATLGGRSKPERLACILRVCVLHWWIGYLRPLRC